MRKLAVFFSILLIVVGVAAAQESYTLSTYYPAPNGFYRDMSVSNNLGVGTANIGILTVGNVSISTSLTVDNQLSVGTTWFGNNRANFKGRVAIGDYAGTTLTGDNGLFVSGPVGLGTTMSASAVNVRGKIEFVRDNDGLTTSSVFTDPSSPLLRLATGYNPTRAGDIYIVPGSSTGQAGSVRIETPDSGNSAGSHITLETGESGSTSGSISLITGSNNNSGSVMINTGDGNSGNAGGIMLATGSGQNRGGSLTLQTGNATAGTGGNIGITAAAGPGGGGNITVQSGSTSNITIKSGTGHLYLNPSGVDGNVGIGDFYLEPGRKLTVIGGAFFSSVLTPEVEIRRDLVVGHAASPNAGSSTFINPATFQNVVTMQGNVGISQNLTSTNGNITLTNGNVSTTNGTMTASSFLHSSDKRLKKDIKPLENSLEKVQKLHGVEFQYKEKPGVRMGFIAQDVEKIFPEAVETNDKRYKTVDYSSLVAPLVEAMKEQQKEIEGLKREIEKLKEQK